MAEPVFFSSIRPTKLQLSTLSKPVLIRLRHGVIGITRQLAATGTQVVDHGTLRGGHASLEISKLRAATAVEWPSLGVNRLVKDQENV